MGSNTSKVDETAAQKQKNEVDVCDNPDPRSPTPEITRTPLQGQNGGKHNITKNVDLRKTFENGETKEKFIHNNPILSAVIKNHLQSYDPRSPTQDFERTPIVISDDDKKLLRRQTETSFASPSLQNDSTDNCEVAIDANSICQDIVLPKNLCREFYDLTLDDSLKETEEPLGSSTASNEAIENNISTECTKKPTGLLETNFDYVENGCEKINHENPIEPFDVVKTKLDIKNAPPFKLLKEDPRSPSTGIDRTPIVVTKTDEDYIRQDNVEEMSDDALIKVLQNTNAELRQSCNVLDVNTDGLLIYEDETSNLHETPKKSTTNSGSRTPLSCMKNKAAGHNRSKSANTLYDPKNQLAMQCKAVKRTSHIPRLKSLSKQSKLIPTGSSISLRNVSKTSVVAGDCENTPPHSHRDRWDKDNSIVL